MKSNILLGNALTVVSVFAWATGFPVTKILLETWDPVLIAMARLGIGALTLMTLLTITGRLGELKIVNWRDALMIGGGFLGSATIGIVIAQDLADPVTVVIITTGMPLVSAIIGRFTAAEPFRPQVLIGISLAIVGGVLAVLATVDEGPGFRGGEVIVLFTMTMFTLFSRASVARFKNVSDITKAAVTLFGAFVVFLPITAVLFKLGIVEAEYDTSVQSILLILWMGGFAIGISMALWLAAGRMLGVTVAAIHQNAAPFHVMIIMLFIGGTFLIEQFFAALLVVAGAVLAQWKFKRKSGP